jgi:wyosine [tRNA(Phe)-imidazoG37] synthetase (radical SAM superfamily)
MNEENLKTVYGPVNSWRFGKSLGIDPIFETSTCSFNCVYCQLGDIQKVTAQRKEFIPTSKIIEDYKEFQDQEFEVITFSGSGEPTLATNLGEIAKGLNTVKKKPLLILTNATTLKNPAVQRDLCLFDRVIVKLDAASQKMLNIMNRPAEGISHQSILEGILEFKKVYKGILDVQMMFMPANLEQVQDLSGLLKQIQPDTVQLNTPKRPYPMVWDRENRGNHTQHRDYESRSLKVVSKREAEDLQKSLIKNTGLNVLSVYRE